MKFGKICPIHVFILGDSLDHVYDAAMAIYSVSKGSTQSDIRNITVHEYSKKVWKKNFLTHECLSVSYITLNNRSKEQ